VFQAGLNQGLRLHFGREIENTGDTFLGGVTTASLTAMRVVAAYLFLYTDPGSGTLIWQLLLAAFFGGMFYVRRLKDYFLRRRK
jgi:hypothetical protein